MPTAEVGRRRVMPTGLNTAQTRWSEALEGSAAAFSTPQERGYHTDGLHHVGQETTVAMPTKPREHVENRCEWVGDEELELDYEEDGDNWEDGEIREEEESGVKKGGRGRKCGTTSSSAFVLQDTGLAEGPSGDRQTMSRGRSMGTPRNLGETDGGCVAGPQKDKMVTWLVGHSFVHWAVKFAEKQIYGRAMGLPSRHYEVCWWRKSGMRSYHVSPLSLSVLCGPPSGVCVWGRGRDRTPNLNLAE
ncbi:uncharacterized protein [Pleurodeles waltl]|uniref:uncharacterized protein n=1 Tax=Pleurodeles waltl TaxID=8319 RepID=UPI00370945A7